MVASYPGPHFPECLGTRLTQDLVLMSVVIRFSAGTIPSGTHASSLEGHGGEGSRELISSVV